MKHTPYNDSVLTLNLIFFVMLNLTLGCSQSGSGGGSDGRVLGSDFAENHWPNETTTESSSTEITSKILISDLDQSGGLENIFISVLPNSSNKKSSVLRITQGPDFSEVLNYKSNRVSLLQDSIPFAYDFNNDGYKELVFVSYDRDQVYAFEFKNKLKKIFIRWTANLPEVLDVDFDRQLKLVFFEEDTMIKVGPFGLYESKNKKVAIVDLREEPKQKTSEEN